MNAHFQALRAAGSLYGLSLVKSFFWVGTGIFIFALVVIGLLAHSFTGWWWLLAIPVVCFYIVFCFVLTLAHVITRKISPLKLNAEQKKQVSAFNQKMKTVIEQTQTSYFIIAFQLLKDLIVHKEARTIKNLIDDSSTLKSDFQTLVTFFK